MPDETTSSSSVLAPVSKRPRINLQDHLADLESAGLLQRIDRTINKDTELQRRPYYHGSYEHGLYYR